MNLSAKRLKMDVYLTTKLWQNFCKTSPIGVKRKREILELWEVMLGIQNMHMS